ncbi:hypothetical protein MtrunA17_Chr5g0414731 [Medicago truncatula]|uniref:Transmembrane protein n=1 Tax=Medicago truncatula TaxID=3880 RepID=A0A396HRQ5_MEDTR|nr:hypothetical protein MtrunA17_Chr5g0414731 [Medicago truncatula]
MCCVVLPAAVFPFLCTCVCCGVDWCVCVVRGLVRFGLVRGVSCWLVRLCCCLCDCVSIYRVGLKLEFVTDEHKISGLWRRKKEMCLFVTGFVSEEA